MQEPEPEEMIEEAVDEVVFSTTPDWGVYSGPDLWGFQVGDLLLIGSDPPTAARVRSVNPFRLEPVVDPARARPTFRHQFQFKPRYRHEVRPLRLVDYSLT